MSTDHEAREGAAPAFRFTRESRIRIDRDGRLFHEGEPVEHEKLARALASWVAVDEGTGRYILRNPLDWCFITVDDAPLAVLSLRANDRGGFDVELSDGATEPLDLGTLRVDGESVPYCDVRGGSIPARFSRGAAFALLEHAEPLSPDGGESEGYVLVLPSGPIPLRRVPTGEGAGPVSALARAARPGDTRQG